MSLKDAKGIETFQTANARNSVIHIPNGPILINDSEKASWGGIGHTIDLLESARVPRKTLVIGNLSDYRGSSSKKYRRFARDAADVGARVIGVGRNAASIEKLLNTMENASIRVFPGSREARDFLKETAVPGELIVLKSATSGHIGRIALSWDGGDERCWIENCTLDYHCSFCRYR